MATGTGGTTANNVLTTVQWKPGYASGVAQADLAAINALILDDVIGGHPNIAESFVYNGMLFIPNRGRINLRPGDRVMVDSQGFPYCVPNRSVTAGAFTSTV